MHSAALDRGLGLRYRSEAAHLKINITLLANQGQDEKLA